MKKTLPVALVLALSLAACTLRFGADRPPPLPDYWPTQGWRSTAPEAQGVDAGALADAIGFVLREDLGLNSLLVVRHGHVVLDASFHPFPSGGLHDLASGTKSFVSTLVGIAIDEGHLTSVRQPVVPLFQGRAIANPSVDKRGMTIEDVLTMRSGLTCIWSNLGGPMEALTRSPDWVQHILDQPMVAEPGSKYCYSNADSHLLSGIVRAATGKPARQYAVEKLFGPMGITEIVWPSDPQGNSVGYAELRMSTRDMAKFGLLFLHRGFWDGRQLVSEEWVAEATRAHHELDVQKGDPFDGYGYQWWRSSWGFYTTRGRGGQFIAVFPRLDLVLVMTAELGDDAQMQKVGELLTRHRLPAVKSSEPLPASAAAAARLDAAVKEAASPRETARPVPPFPPTAGRISGKRFVFERNLLDLESFTITFKEGAPEAAVVMTLANGMTLALPAGLDGVSRVGAGRFGLPAAMKGGWKGDSVFEATLDELGNNARWTLTAKFEGESVSFHAAGAGMGAATLAGRIAK